MSSGNFDTLVQDAPQGAFMPQQPYQPKGHVWHEHGIPKQEMSESPLRRSSFTDAEIEALVSEAVDNSQASASIPACPEAEHQGTFRDSFWDVEPSAPSTPDGSFLAATSSTGHENKELGAIGSMQSRCALVPPRSPEMTAGEPNRTSTGGPAHAHVGLSNDSTSSGPICRICHEGEQEAALLSMCKCSGSQGLVHVSCLERWLNARNANDCELCHHRFPTTTTYRNRPLTRFFHWLLQCETQPLCGTLEQVLIFLFLSLTPIATCYLSEHSTSFWNHAWLGPFLMTTFVVIYTATLVLVARGYYMSFLSWQSENQIRMLLVPPPASGNGASDNTASKQATSSM